MIYGIKRFEKIDKNTYGNWAIVQFIKPYWLEYNNLFVTKYLYIWSKIILSKIFDMEDNNDIGL